MGVEEKEGYQGKRIQEEKHNAKKIRRKSQRDEEQIVLCENRGKLSRKKRLTIQLDIMS